MVIFLIKDCAAVKYSATWQSPLVVTHDHWNHYPDIQSFSETLQLIGSPGLEVWALVQEIYGGPIFERRTSWPVMITFVVHAKSLTRFWSAPVFTACISDICVVSFVECLHHRTSHMVWPGRHGCGMVIIFWPQIVLLVALTPDAVTSPGRGHVLTQQKAS